MLFICSQKNSTITVDHIDKKKFSLKKYCKVPTYIKRTKLDN
jgi:hypothetical protein